MCEKAASKRTVWLLAAIPVVFVHGNGQSGATWADVMAEFRRAGYAAETLHAVTYLSDEQQTRPRSNVHTAAQADVVAEAVRDAGPRVDVISHSLGVTTALHAISREGLWPRVRKFIAIAGAMRGLSSCLSISPWFPLVPTCLGESPVDADRFGFHPFANPRMADGGFRDVPLSAHTTTFHVIHAGRSDEITCATGMGCDTNLFDPAPNVSAPIEVSGGHFGARSGTAALQLGLLAE